MYFSEYYNKRKKDIIKEEKEIVKVPTLYDFYVNFLLDKVINIFEWTGLPFPQKEIEQRLILHGFCGVVNDNKVGLMVATGGLSGVTEYYDEFLYFTYSAPTAQGGTKVIGKNCVIIDNTTLRTPLISTIEKYASLLAHVDTTLKVSLVNMRKIQLLKGSDDSQIESLQLFENKVYEGDTSIIRDDQLIESQISEVLNNGQSGNIAKVSVEVKQEIIRQFFNEFGIRYTKEKKGNMTEDEVDNDEQFLLHAVDDMLKRRQEGAKEFSRVFNRNISCKLNKEYELLRRKEVKEYENSGVHETE